MDHNRLTETAKAFLKNSNSTFSNQTVTNIITVYEKIMKDQTNAFKSNGNIDFFGARDFYGLIKHKVALAERPNSQSLESYFCNFGGLDHSDYRKQFKRNLMEKKYCQSLDLSVSRHCMITSEKYYSWQLLLEYIF
ncbi:hypothetical protein RFI_07499 [Reticulomyxa filosa]|uniref:Uncharacterized protein n=1 Tax=Reticulomyxa filosa TaxID=46433 RepID=X6NUB2_RETFI|nr:hypothetical protein RFI_07499 [Reticulomyxa filosa]|eukprot:ETO29621.1 hypothetical protein RFI_07499 [Reticulomyxa filosa]